MIRIVSAAIVGCFVLVGCSAQSEPDAEVSHQPVAAATQVRAAGAAIDLPIPATEVDQIVSTTYQVLTVVTNPNLNREQQNDQTADSSTGTLVVTDVPVASVPVELKPVVVQRFTYLSKDQVQIEANAGDQTLYVTLIPQGQRWLVDDITSDGCSSGSACPFDPSVVPTLPPEKN